MPVCGHPTSDVWEHQRAPSFPILLFQILLPLQIPPHYILFPCDYTSSKRRELQTPSSPLNSSMDYAFALLSSLCQAWWHKKVPVLSLNLGLACFLSFLQNPRQDLPILWLGLIGKGFGCIDWVVEELGESRRSEILLQRGLWFVLQELALRSSDSSVEIWSDFLWFRNWLLKPCLQWALAAEMWSSSNVSSAESLSPVWSCSATRRAVKAVTWGES